MNKPDEEAFARRGRVVALVIAASGLLTILAPWIRVNLGLAPRFEMLMYLFALAGMAWALVVAVQMWRKRKEFRD